MTTEPVTTPPVAEDVTGKRVVAGFIDVVVLGIVFVVMSSMTGGTDTEGASFSVNLDTGPAAIYFLIVMAYHIIPEGLTGQSLGKKVVGLKVVALDGPLTWGKVIVRNLLRLVDGLPIFYLLGIILIAVSRDKQRLGDMAAKTVVVSA